MTTKQFPGTPEFFDLIFAKNLAQASDDLSSHGTEESKKLADIFTSLSMCLLSQRDYFDLMNDVNKYYSDVKKFWDEEVFKANGGKIGSGKIEFKEAEEVNGIDKKLLESLYPPAFNLLMGMLTFTQDRDAISKSPDFNEELFEQMSILNRILYTIYIGCFNRGILEKNHRIFVEAKSRLIMRNPKFN